MINLTHQRGYYYIKDDNHVIERHRNQSKAIRRYNSLSKRVASRSQKPSLENDIDKLIVKENKNARYYNS